MKKKLSVLVVFFALISCKKEGGTGVVEPLSYFPVYPGSYWQYEVYRNSYKYDSSLQKYIVTRVDTSLFYDSVSSDYLPHSYRLAPTYANGHYTERYSETAFVPFLNGKPIYQYDRIDKASQMSGPDYDSRYPFLSEHPGDTLIAEWYDPHSIPRTFVVIHDKTIDQAGDSIIVVRIHNIYPDFYDIIEWLTYKKNVGLISHSQYSESRNDTIYRKVLKKYLVNKK